MAVTRKFFCRPARCRIQPDTSGLTRQAHPQPRIAENAWNSANPVRAYTKWLKEDADYIKFVNPGDLRVAEETCGRSGCHAAEVRRVQTSMMTHGAMLWGAALYNNGAFPLKDPHFGESYGRDGTPQRLQTYPPPTADETEKKGVLPYLEPLQRWEVSQPGNVLRVFERGGGRKAETGIPLLDEEPGRPDVKLSFTGLWNPTAYRPHIPGIAEDPLARSSTLFSRYQRSAGRLPRQRLQRLPCDLCQRSRAKEHSASYAQYGNLGQTRHPRSHHS